MKNTLSILALLFSVVAIANDTIPTYELKPGEVRIFAPTYEPVIIKVGDGVASFRTEPNYLNEYYFFENGTWTNQPNAMNNIEVIVHLRWEQMSSRKEIFIQNGNLTEARFEALVENLLEAIPDLIYEEGKPKNSGSNIYRCSAGSGVKYLGNSNEIEIFHLLNLVKYMI